MLSSPSLKVLSEELDGLGALIRGGMKDGTLELDALLDAYQSCRRRVAKVLGRLSTEAVDDNKGALEQVRALVAARMRKSYEAFLPEHLLKPRSYGQAHRLLFAYLVSRVGRATPASRLRVLTGDQVHTERRVRELRELGIQISWTRQAGENHYTLLSAEPTVSEGAKLQATMRVRGDKSLSTDQRNLLVLRLDQPSH